jgi:hypothetical protein
MYCSLRSEPEAIGLLARTPFAGERGLLRPIEGGTRNVSFAGLRTHVRNAITASTFIARMAGK